MVNQVAMYNGLYFYCEYAAEGLVFGNSVYWIRFDEEFSDKVIFSYCSYMVFGGVSKLPLSFSTVGYYI